MKIVGKRWLILGGVLLGLWLYLPSARWFFHSTNSAGTTQYSASQIHAVCNSSIGQIAQSFSAKAASNCALANDMYTLFTVIFILGLLSLVVWAVKMIRTGSIVKVQVTSTSETA